MPKPYNLINNYRYLSAARIWYEFFCCAFKIQIADIERHNVKLRNCQTDS